MTKVLIILILTTFSCVNPQIKPQERCSVSFKFNKCRCHEYDLMSAKRISEAYDRPLEYCEDLTGFHVDAWGLDITPWAKESIRYYKDTCKSK